MHNKFFLLFVVLLVVPSMAFAVVENDTPNFVVLHDYFLDINEVESVFIVPYVDDYIAELNFENTTVNLTNQTDIITALERPAGGADISYTPDSDPYAHFENGISSFSNDFFLGKNEFTLEFDLIPLDVLAGTAF